MERVAQATLPGDRVPDVTVVIPTRDRWPILESCGLRAALLQTDVDLEVIVVDDGSTDETRDRLMSIPDPRLRTLRHESPRGVSAARNTGIGAGRGRWIALLDDDDIWAPTKLRRQLDAAQSAQRALVYSGVVVVDSKLDVLHTTVPTATSADDLRARNTIPAGSSNVVVRSNLLRNVGGFDERLSYCADWDLWIRLAAESSFAILPDLLTGYVRHGSGMVFTGRVAIDEMRYLIRKHAQGGLRADPTQFLSWVATQDRLAGRRRDAAATYLASAIAFRKPSQLLHAAASLLDVRGRGSLRPGKPQAAPATWEPVSVEWLDAYR